MRLILLLSVAVSVTSALSWAQVQAAKAALEAEKKEKELKDKLAKEAANSGTKPSGTGPTDENKELRPDTKPEERPKTPDLKPLDEKETERPQRPSTNLTEKPNEKPDKKPIDRPGEDLFDDQNGTKPTKTPLGTNPEANQPSMESDSRKPTPKETIDNATEYSENRNNGRPDDFEKPEPRRTDTTMARPIMPVDHDKKTLEKLQNQARELENSMSIQFYEMAVRMAINNLDSMISMAEPMLLQIHEQISSIVNLTTFDEGSLSTHPAVLLIQDNQDQVTNATHQLMKIGQPAKALSDDLTGVEWSTLEEIVNDLVDQLRNRTNGFETTPMLKKVTEFFGGSEFMLDTAMDWWQSYMELEDLQDDIYALMRKVSHKDSHKKPTSYFGSRPTANRDYHQDDFRQMTNQNYRESADRYAAEMYQKFVDSPNAINEMMHRNDESKDHLKPGFEQFKKQMGDIDLHTEEENHRYENHQNDYGDRHHFANY